VTGHEGEDSNKGETSVNWKKLPGAVDTIVVLMGIGQLEQISRDLIKGGMKKTTRVAIVESGTTDRQRVVTGTLAGVARLAAKNNVRPPAIVVIGKVASLHEKIGWFKGGKSSGPV
jgi:siroheme synthase